MTNGIGNPDWQRRYVTSAVPIFDLVYPDNVNGVSGVQDSNGYQYLVVSTSGFNSLVYAHVKVDWFQDQAATLAMGVTDWTIPPQSFIVTKVPVITRFYKVEIGPVGGTTGNNVTCVTYGTNLDQENLLTQNTAIPLGWGTPNVAAGATSTTILGGGFGGRVSVFVGQQTNNKWTAWLEYYDWTTQAWNKFWIMHGTDRGMSFRDDANLPYAPIRMNVRNDDTVAQGITWSVIAP